MTAPAIPNTSRYGKLAGDTRAADYTTVSAVPTMDAELELITDGIAIAGDIARFGSSSWDEFPTLDEYLARDAREG